MLFKILLKNCHTRLQMKGLHICILYWLYWLYIHMTTVIIDNPNWGISSLLWKTTTKWPPTCLLYRESLGILSLVLYFYVALPYFQRTDPTVQQYSCYSQNATVFTRTARLIKHLTPETTTLMWTLSMIQSRHFSILSAYIYGFLSRWLFPRTSSLNWYVSFFLIFFTSPVLP